MIFLLLLCLGVGLTSVFLFVVFLRMFLEVLEFIATAVLAIILMFRRPATKPNAPGGPRIAFD